MPDHDLFDLDDAFSSLERDIATISSPRGAGQAVASARRRRRTTYGAIAAVAVLAVGAVAIGQGTARNGAVGPSEQPVPPPTPLTAGAFSTATAGWIDGWDKPTTQAGTLAGVTCLAQSARDQRQSGGGGSNALDHATQAGETVYGAGSREIAYVVGMEFPADRIDAAVTAITGSAGDCKPTVSSTTTYTDGSQVSFYQLAATSDSGDLELWTARYDDRLALAVMGGTTSEPPADVVARVGDLLIGGLQVDSTFTSVSDGNTISTESSSTSAPTPAYPAVSEADFAQALGNWPNGWQERGTKDAAEPLPCAGDWASGSPGGSGASLGSNGEQDLYSFGNSADAAVGAAALAANLHDCPSSPATVTQVDGTGNAPPVTVVVGSGDKARVTWITQHGAMVSYITVPGSTNPPDDVSLRVAGLMLDASNRVTGGGSSPVESSTAPAPKN